MTSPERSDFPAIPLLAWYDRHARDLPWRALPERGAQAPADPYRVWLSEVMLQQTTVEAVKPYFARFLARWPDVASLAAAPEEEVLKAWAGLGYYSRARNLKKCAEEVVARHGGRLPAEIAELRALPGIGAYTAAAVAAIAHGRPAAVVDGNVERVVARLRAIETPLPAAKAEIAAAVADMVPAERPGDFAQAMMDLGATICTPRRPSCIVCPLARGCRALKAGDPARLPLRAAKPDKPARRGAGFVAVDAQGAVLVRRREAKGLLAGMTEVPGSGWSASGDGSTGADAAPFAADWRRVGTIAHVFTHFSLELTVHRTDVAERPQGVAGWWSDRLAEEALPTVMRKVIEKAVPGATARPGKITTAQ
jgi:A/G-specific adenine glycosylase